MAIRVPVLLDISGDADVDIERPIRRAISGVDVGGDGERIGREFGSGFDSGASSTLQQAVTRQGSAIARLIGGFSALLTTLVPVGPALGGVAAGALAVAGAVGQASVSALSAGGVLAALGQGFAAVQVGSLGVGDALTAQAAAQEELATTGAVAESTQQNLAAAMEGLAPAAQQLVGVVSELGPAWSTFQGAVQQELFAGLGAQLSDLSGSILPSLQANLTGTAAILNGAASAFTAFITSGGGAGQINTVMAGLNNTLNALLPAIGSIGQGLLTLFAGSVGSATSLAAAISSVTAGFAGWAEGVVQSGALRASLEAAAQTMGTLLGILGNLGSILGSVFGAGVTEGQGLLTAFQGATGALAAFLNTAAGTSGLQSFYDLIQQVGASVGILGGVFGPVFGAIGTLIGALIPVMEQLRAALQPVITALAENLNVAIQGLAPVVGVVLGVVASLIAALAPLVTLILNALGPALQTIGELFSTSVAPALQQLTAALTPVISALVAAFGPIVTNIINTLVGVIGGLFEVLGGLITFITGVFTGNWDQAWQGIQQVFSGVVNAVKALLSGMLTNFQLIFSSIFSAVSGWWNRLVANTSATLTRLVTTARLIFDNLPEILYQIAVKAAAAVLNGLNQAVGFVQDVGSQIASTVQGWGSLLYDAGANIINGLISGIQSVIGSVGSAMSGVAQTIRDYLPFSPAKTGPLSGSGSPDKSGATIAEMLAGGIRGGGSDVSAAMNGLLSPVSANVNAGVRGGNGLLGGPGAAVAGVQVTNNLYGPTTGSDVLRESEWTARFAPRASRFEGPNLRGVQS